MTEPARRTLIGDAERDACVALLREHYAAGRLTIDELDRRVGLVLAAAYADEAAVALAELPGAVPFPAGPPSSPRRGWRQRGRHAEASEPGAGWVPTEERFRDPSSGLIMRVWVNPADQSRHYIPDSR